MILEGQLQQGVIHKFFAIIIQQISKEAPAQFLKPGEGGEALTASWPLKIKNTIK